MSKIFKIILLLLIIINIISGVAAVLAFIAKEREYTKRIILEDKLAATLKDKKRLEDEIELAKKAQEQSSAKIKELEIKIKGLESTIDGEKEKSKTALLNLSNKEEELAKLKEELEKERKEKINISKRLEDMEFDYTRAKAEITRLKDEKTQLEKRIADLKEKSVDLDKIVVNPNAPSSTPTQTPPVLTPTPKEPLRGRVLVVNKEYSFIVTDLGQKDGLQKGMIFEIMDGTESLGKAEIDKVYDTMSSATVLPNSKISNMKKGNLIIESR